MTDVRPILELELPILREIAAQTGDPGLSALLIAASNEQIQQILVERLQDGNSYIGALLSRKDERIQVVFSISRAEGNFGLLPLSVLASVNLQERCVVSIVDHYLEGSTELDIPLSLGALRPEIDLTTLMQERPSEDRFRQLGIGRLTQRVANGPRTFWV